MQILLANAKIMFEQSEMKALTQPRFQAVANELAMEMASLDVDSLAKELDCSRALAAENWRRYQNFFTAEGWKAEDASCMGEVLPWSHGALHSTEPNNQS